MKALLILIEVTGDRQAMMEAFGEILDQHNMHPDLGCLAAGRNHLVSWDMQPWEVENLCLGDVLDELHKQDQEKP